MMDDCVWGLLVVVAAAAAARELDPAACGARFDVQRDKIIRTEESRAMGARYLAELDVGARAECLRLCCETDACDVFVYEEKSPGSCYLFACGPPEDFRCKFTAHGNFSSGVLALARQRAEQQDSARLALHEQQLASLRSATSTTTSSSTTPPPAPPAPPAPPTTAPATPPPPPPPPPRRCSRYQFECHSGGECIAVYNACDGVPQCADGSDEAPELGCPPPAPAPRPAPPAAPRPAPPAAPPARAAGSAEAAGEGLAGERWPHRLAQAQPHRYNGVAETGGPHIFSHQGGLLQAPPYPAAWPRAPWPPPQTAAEGGEGAGGMEGAGGEGGVEGAWGAASGGWAAPAPRRAWPAPPPRADPEIPMYIPQKTMPELPRAYGGQHTLRDAPKKGPPAPAAPPPRAPEPAPSELSIRGYGHLKPTQVAPAARAARPPADERDGLSDRPPAAVLLLVLGVLLTAGALLPAGCRARAARRRLRRGKSPFAHDADYLVNGMYL